MNSEPSNSIERHAPGAGEDTESLLRELPLAKPSARFDARMGQTLSSCRTIGFSWSKWAAAAALIAAIIGTVLLATHRSPTGEHAISPPKPPKVIPVISDRPLRIERDTAHLADAGIVAFAGKTPLHGYRYESVRQIWFVDPHGHRLCVTVPSERFVLVPVHPF